MNAWKMSLAAAALAASMLVPVQAASPFSSLVVFGDSLSDPGNAAALTSGAFPPPPYDNGHFGNGPTAAEYLATALGALPNNFAVGGAMTGNGNYNYTANSPNGISAFTALATTGMAQQIASYNPVGLDPAHTLFMVWGGPNDVFLGLVLGSNPTTVVNDATTNLVSDISTLVAKGARNFLVPDMPDLGQTPDYIGTPYQADLTAISVGFNTLLAGKLSFLRGSLPSDAHIYTSSVFNALNNAIDHPGDYGFTTVSESCLSGGTAALASNCAGYLFFDGVHPTTQAHALLAQQFAAAVPEPETYALMLFGLAAVGAVVRRRG